MNNKKAWLFAGGTFLLFVLVSGLASRLLGLQGSRLWILVGVLWLLGLVASWLVFLFVKSGAGKQPAASAPDRELDLAIKTAQARLASSRKSGANKLGALPLTLFVGPTGGTKTATIVQSGLEPELLAGEAHRGDAIVPTEGVNVWYSEQMILLEAGGKVLEDAGRWNRLIRHIQPSRLGAVFARGTQAPRMVVVCLGCDELLKPGSAEAIPATAQKLRARLAEVSEQLGIRLPVYVLFTKADRLPYFRDYVRSFSRDEAQEVLGATLPVPAGTETGSYAERESRRLHEAFGQLFHSLALKRLEVLPRDTPEEVKSGAYEFPREFRKTSDLAIGFLVELCKPSRLSVSPFLRGFYFTGARATVVSEAAAQPAAAMGLGAAAPLGATSVFNARELLQASTHAPPAPGSRNVLEWLFLKRVFRDVILRDQTAMGITGGGTRVNLLRRSLLGFAAALLFVFSIGLVVSYVNNRTLVRNANAAAAGVERLEINPAEGPSVEALRRLDALRAQAELVGNYERKGHPWRLGWGLYTGSTLHPKLRTLYFDRFERLLWGQTRQDLLASLNGLPPAPTETSDYGSTYEDLKAHLITTSHPQESTSAFLTPVLMKHSLAGRETDPERADLARRQFDFYARELAFGNPYTHPRNEQLVTRTRGFLEQFAGIERFYQAMVSEASRANRAIQFHQAFPGTEAVVRNQFVVPGAFTQGGWAFVQKNLSNVDRLFARERWVVGDQAIAAGNRAQLARDLRARYIDDYLRNWQEYLNAGSVLGFANTSDAAMKLGRLSSNQSPLLQMLALASRNTDVDSATIGQVFRPVHMVTPPKITDRFVSEPNSAYVQAVGSLGTALATVTSTPAEMRQQPLIMASTSAQQVEGEVQKIAQNFSLEGAAQQVGSTVQRLLRTPAIGAMPVIQSAFASIPAPTVPGVPPPPPPAAAAAAAPPPAASVNQAGDSFCQPFRQLARVYPFNSQASTDAAAEDVSAAFKPGGSALSQLKEETATLVALQGSRYVPKPGATPQASPGFVEFLNRANQISNALYSERGAGPEVVFQLRPQATSEIPEITVSIDGKRATFTRTSAASETFVWDGSSANEARIIGRIGGAETPLLEASGTWGLFRLFQQAAWDRTGPGRYTLRWRVPSQQAPLTAELTFAGGDPVFMRDFLRMNNCVSQIAR